MMESETGLFAGKRKGLAEVTSLGQLKAKVQEVLGLSQPLLLALFDGEFDEWLTVVSLAACTGRCTHSYTHSCTHRCTQLHTNHRRRPGTLGSLVPLHRLQHAAHTRSGHGRREKQQCTFASEKGRVDEKPPAGERNRAEEGCGTDYHIEEEPRSVTYSWPKNFSEKPLFKGQPRALLDAPPPRGPSPAPVARSSGLRSPPHRRAAQTMRHPPLPSPSAP